MDPTELAYAGVARQAELVRRGEVSSRELVELYLERIERLDPELNSYLAVMPERALADADQADARRAAGGERPLLGVPLAVKDVHDVAGQVTTLGTAANTQPARQDSEIVARLRTAGAVILGKTNLPELAICGVTEGPAFGVTRNPWNTDRTPGGSSGGSAAAVAAGLAAAATASDGAGSIRIPAANCGLFGLKPQRDRISLAPAREHWYGLSVNGFETRTVLDTALLLDATAADAPARPFAEEAARPPGKLRVAVSTRAFLFAGMAGSEVKRVVGQTAEVLRSLGHAVERRDPAYGTASNTSLVRYLRGIADDAAEVERPERLQRRTRGFAHIGRLFPDSAVAWARREEAGHAARINELFRDHDVLLMPVTARPPVGAAQWEGRSAMTTLLGMAATYPFPIAWNLTGQPAASVPVGQSNDGLPIGLQLVGRHGDEATLLSLSVQLESELAWPERRPPVS